MKVKMLKHNMERVVDSGSIELFLSAGWKPAESIKATDEVIRLKPPAKSKSAVKTLDDTITQGDE